MTEQMKPSGIERIGDIPHDWEISKIKYNVLIPVTDGPHETPVFVEEGIPFYSVDGIQNDHLVYEPCRYISYADANRYDAKVKPTYGDILMGKAASVGKIAIIDQHVRLQVWSPLAIIRTDEEKVHNQYLRYYLLSDPAQVEIDLKSTANTQKNIAMEDIENLIITKPSVEEQKAITFFLNAQCAKIEGIIADIEKQIETLQKYKKSLITETVTKGLDKSVPMKDSGVACIGLVPQNWTYKKLGYMAEVTKLAGFEFTDYFEYVDEGVIAVRGLNLKNFDISLADIQHIPEKTSDMLPRSQIHYNDVLISYAGTVGSVGLVTDTTKRYHLAPNVGKVTVLSELIPRYLAYYLISYAGQEHIDQLKNKNAQESISMENIRRIKVLVPSQVEQQNICDYLDKKVNAVDTIISGQQKKLKLMQTHKKSLIYEYVTGKKRVTEVN